MQIDSKTLLCRYRYDALNRLVASTPSAQADTQRFYLKDRLTTEIQGAEQRSIMQHEDQLLAQQQRQSGIVETRLLATDRQRSVLNVLAASRPNFLAYTLYGHRHPENGLLSLLGFNGERPDPVTGHYLLGNGYRAFNPVLMRFNSPDSWSPFGEGGLNAYAYCEGDPLNLVDPTGHLPNVFKSVMNFFGRTPQKAQANRTYKHATLPPTKPTLAAPVSRTSSEPPLKSPNPPPVFAPNGASTQLLKKFPQGDEGTPPPPYSGGAEKQLNPNQQIVLTTALRIRMETFNGIKRMHPETKPVPPIIQSGMKQLTVEINKLRGALGRPPMYSEN